MFYMIYLKYLYLRADGVSVRFPCVCIFTMMHTFILYIFLGLGMTHMKNVQIHRPPLGLEKNVSSSQFL